MFAQSWGLFSPRADLEHCGFLCNRRSYSKVQLDKDNMLAQVLFDVYNGVVSETYMSMLFWTDRFPGLFVGLLQPDLGKRKQNMDRVHRQFELFQSLERETANSAFAKTFLADLQWPSQPFCMELFYMLYEIDFDPKLTDEIVSCIRGYARSWLSNLIDEDGFCHLRERSSNQSTGKMGRAARWGSLAFSNLLRQRHGRTPVPVTPVARAQAPGPATADSFQATSVTEFSLGRDLLRKMSEPNRRYPSAKTDKLVGAMWKAFQLCEGNIKQIQQCWVALLASPGVVLCNVDKEPYGIVLASNQWLVIYQPLELLQINAKENLLVPHRHSKPEAAVLTNFGAHKAFRVKVLSPTNAATFARQDTKASGIAFQRVCPNAGLAEIAAQEGFKQMTNTHLEKLLDRIPKHFEKGGRPKHPDDILKFLVKHFIPSASAKEIAAALAQRDQSGPLHDLAKRSVLLKGDNMDLMADSFGYGDTEEFQKDITSGKNLFGA